jgi:23S rRNA pseudouridine2604 synthase
MEKVRLSKIMAERGMCSRREADAYIEKGWVKVNGEPVTVLGTRISPDQAITLDPRARQAQAQRLTVLLNKPVGYVSGQPEKHYQAAVALITAYNHDPRDPVRRALRGKDLRGLAPAGRLDIDSQGLLVLTQDGRIARQLIGAQSRTEKEYLVRIEGRVTEETLALLQHGLSLDGKPLRQAGVSRLNRDQLRFVLTEGRKRQIRRMCELVGLKVIGLKRVRIGKVRLGKLPLGNWRYLKDGESF